MLPDLSFERLYWNKNRWVIGVDEVGRGALSGPVFAAASCIDMYKLKNPETSLSTLGIDDSKRLTASIREKIFHEISRSCFFFSVASCSVTHINRKGIVHATHTAMRKAIRRLTSEVAGFYPGLSRDFILIIDGYPVKHIRYFGLKNQNAMIKADQQSISVAASSIIAKVLRDRYMTKLSRSFPVYAWDNNKGYGTAKHIRAIKQYGCCKHHRDLFVRNFV